MQNGIVVIHKETVIIILTQQYVGDLKKRKEAWNENTGAATQEEVVRNDKKRRKIRRVQRN